MLAPQPLATVTTTVTASTVRATFVTCLLISLARIQLATNVACSASRAQPTASLKLHFTCAGPLRACGRPCGGAAFVVACFPGRGDQAALSASCQHARFSSLGANISDNTRKPTSRIAHSAPE